MDANKDDNLPDGPLDPEELKELEQVMAAQTKMTAQAMEAMGATATMRRSERLQVASRVLAALITEIHTRRSDDPQTDAGKLADDALWYADALLARIDETEADGG